MHIVYTHRFPHTLFTCTTGAIIGGGVSALPEYLEGGVTGHAKPSAGLHVGGAIHLTWTGEPGSLQSHDNMNTAADKGIQIFMSMEGDFQTPVPTCVTGNDDDVLMTYLCQLNGSLKSACCFLKLWS